MTGNLSSGEPSGTPFEGFFRRHNAVMILLDENGDLIDANDRALAFYGYSLRQMKKMNIREINQLPADELNASLHEFAVGMNNHFKRRHRLASGEIREVEVSTISVDLDNKKFLFSIIFDRTDAEHVSKSLVEKQLRYDLIFNSSNDALFVMNITEAGTPGLFTEVNDSLCALLDYTREELLAMSVKDIDDGVLDYSKDDLRWIAEKGRSLFERVYSSKSGKKIPVEVSTKRFLDNGKRCSLSIVRDITERKKMEAERLQFKDQYQQLQKLEALGVLAGGIAHDFNNLMGGIYGFVELARERSGDDEVFQYLSKAMNTIHRAKGLTAQLLTFAKGGAPVQHVGPLFPFIKETVCFMLSGSTIACTFDVSEDLRHCNFDENQIARVIDNIIINAQQAMPCGGTIAVAAKNIELNNNERLILKPGNYCKISIKDSGVGISREVLPRIFDPFFTTKATGHGLGLTTCFSIIKRHGGTIEVESEPGTGAAFHIYLPASSESAATEKATAPEKHRASGRILVVDDEDVMREAMGDMLEMFGYAVILIKEGKDAVDFFESEATANRSFAAILFDLTIPGGMGGRDAIVHLRAINADIPVFAISGYAEDPVMAHPENYGFTGSICKPFKMAELAAKLNNYL